MTRDPAAVLRLHREVDGAVAELERRHRDRLRCRRGCADCCVDDLTVFEVEAEAIRTSYPDLLETGEPHPVGACAFLDADGACRVYDARPYVCRTQGVPLRWFQDHEEFRVVELRDICPRNATGPDLESLPERDCWTIGPVEGRLAEIQEGHGSGAMRRVALRALFGRRS